jgi:8-oxo-dGTP diphosphatase
MDQEPDTEGVKAVVRGKDGKFLLMKRAEHKDEYPGYWEFQGGGLEDETPEGGVLRELEEETGIKAEVTGEKGGFTWDSDFTDRQIKSHSFLIEVEKTEVELSREHTRYEWLELEEIFEKRHFPHIRKDLKHAGVELD